MHDMGKLRNVFFPSFSADITFAFAVYNVHDIFFIFMFKALQRMAWDRDVNCHSNIPEPSAPVCDNQQPGLEPKKCGGKPPCYKAALRTRKCFDLYIAALGSREYDETLLGRGKCFTRKHRATKNVYVLQNVSRYFVLVGIALW